MSTLHSKRNQLINGLLDVENALYSVQRPVLDALNTLRDINPKLYYEISSKTYAALTMLSEVEDTVYKHNTKLTISYEPE